MSTRPLPAPVKAALRALERRLFLVLFAFGCGRSLWRLCLLLLCLYGIDRLLEPPLAVRLVLEASAGLLLLWWMRGDLLRPLRRRPARRDLAAIYERHVPSLGDRLATTVAASEGHAAGSPALLQVVAEEAAAQASQLDPRPIVPTGRARRSLLQGAIASALLLSGIALFPTEAAVWWQRARGMSLAWPSATRLVLMPVYLEGAEEPLALRAIGPEHQGVAVARGSVLSLRVRAIGEVPERVIADGGPAPASLHALGGGDFVLRLPPLQEDLSLRFRGGDDDDGLPRLDITVGDPPRLASWEVTVRPPAYTGLPEERGNMHELRVLQGSELTLQFSPDRATEEVTMRALDGTSLPVTATADGQYRVQSPVDRAGEWVLAWSGSDGFRDERVTVLKWSVIHDQAPEPQILFPDERWLTVPGGTIPVALRASDDYGLANWSLRGLADGDIPLPPLGRVRQASQMLRLPAPTELSAEGFGDTRFRLQFSAEDWAEPVANRHQVESPWIEVLPAVVEEQRLSERIVQMRGKVEKLRDEISLYANGSETAVARRARRLLRDLENLLADSERLLLERMYSALDRGCDSWLPLCDDRLAQGFPEPGQVSAIFDHPTLAPPLDRAGMLLALSRSLASAHGGAGKAWLEAVQAEAGSQEAAQQLQRQLDDILRVLMSWEDFNSAINLLRSLLDRQRGLYLRTREASER